MCFRRCKKKRSPFHNADLTDKNKLLLTNYYNIIFLQTYRCFVFWMQNYEDYIYQPFSFVPFILPYVSKLHFQ